ncbi:unnamed protein product [Vitrella brassicaformis CCMP3155]|uniref:Mechanosensitive ion channel MscS domain-containing protein n=1 Tax=Vitrella brassicaformis (strain CCMP3155) TaxID=1169540 RepID=A0A0G4G4Q2_VITBC|nr:unnamed protein product [Vitrella brassicaformis CCMP3155]|eukprot:CEM23242.1 unnamed protein product [Vitrella brassicaformis CCMP3155]
MDPLDIDELIEDGPLRSPAFPPDRRRILSVHQQPTSRRSVCGAAAAAAAAAAGGQADEPTTSGRFRSLVSGNDGTRGRGESVGDVEAAVGSMMRSARYSGSGAHEADGSTSVSESSFGDTDDQPQLLREGTHGTSGRCHRLVGCIRFPNRWSLLWYSGGCTSLVALTWTITTTQSLTPSSPLHAWLALAAVFLIARMVSFLFFGLMVTVAAYVDPEANLPSSLVIETLHLSCGRVLWYGLTLLAYGRVVERTVGGGGGDGDGDGKGMPGVVSGWMKVVLVAMLVRSILTIVRELLMTYVSVQSSHTRNRQLQIMVWKQRAFARLNRLPPRFALTTHLHALRKSHFAAATHDTHYRVSIMRHTQPATAGPPRLRRGWTAAVSARKDASRSGGDKKKGCSSGEGKDGQPGGGNGSNGGNGWGEPTAWQSWRARSHVICHPLRLHLKGHHRVDIESRADVRSYGSLLFTHLLEAQHQLFAACDANTDTDTDTEGIGPASVNYLTRSLLTVYLCQEDTDRFMTIVDPIGSGRVTRGRFLSSLLAAHTERQQLLASLRIDENVADIVKNLLHMLEWVMVGITVLYLSGVNLYGTLIGAFTIFTGLAFALGNTFKNFFDSLVFVFVQHPMDIGDRVVVNGGVPMYVKRINVMSSTFVTMHNKQVSMPNFQLSTATITNESKSPPAKFEMIFSDTSGEQFAALRGRLADYCQKSPADWLPGPTINVYDIQPDHHMRVEQAKPHHPTPPTSPSFVGAWATHVSSWGEVGAIYSARSSLFLHLLSTMRELGISYKLPCQPVALQPTGMALDVCPPSPAPSTTTEFIPSPRML